MSEKQFEHIENRIREAAENSEPDYDEHAWELMEARLNKEDNKRPGFLLWVFALLFLGITAGGIYWWIGAKNEKFGAKEELQIKDKSKPVERNSKNVSTVAGGNLVTQGSSKAGPEQLDNSVAIATLNQPSLSQHTITSGSQMSKPKRVFRVVQKGNLSTKTMVPEMDSNKELGNITEPETPDPVAIEQRTNNRKIISDIKRDSLQMEDSTFVKAGDGRTGSKPINKNSRKASRFYLLAVLGADAGSIKLLSFKNNEITPKYGIGIGYQLNKSLSIQTGFYASWKKYLAGPGDYHSNAGSYWSTVKMIKVDASCLVYDIPLTIRYDFIQKPSTNYFVTAGLSSFIMKTEDYKYYYTRNNVYYQTPKSYTGNKTFLSQFNLSAGVEKSITPSLSLLVEPSLALPLAGVGEGSVKLYSTALQFGIKYNLPKRIK